MDIVNPPGWPRPSGYSNAVVARGSRIVFVAGQVGWNAEQKFDSSDFAAQFDRALANVMEVLKTAGAAPEHVCRMTVYVTDKREYLNALDKVGEAYRRHMSNHYPAMTLVQVASLLEEAAKVEIECTAVLE